MTRVLLRAGTGYVREKLEQRLAESGFTPVEEGEEVTLIVQRCPDAALAEEVRARLARGGGAVVVVKREQLAAAERLLAGSGAAVLAADVSFPVLAGALQAEAKAGERLFAVSEELFRLREKLESEKLVMRAKLVLVEGGMSEGEAHRLLEKQAMDRRITRREAAEEIVRRHAAGQKPAPYTEPLQPGGKPAPYTEPLQPGGKPAKEERE